MTSDESATRSVDAGLVRDYLPRRALGQYGRGMAAKPFGDVDPYVLKVLPTLAEPSN
jgi:hypothetical protein